MKYVVIAAVIFLVFGGGKKLSDVGKGLGEGIRNFKDVFKSDETPAKGESEPEKKA
jgi:TatA/E family protein of Tat protein translocase